MVRNEEFDDVGTHKVDGYGGVTENVRSVFGKQTAEIVDVGFAGGEHGGSNGDDIGRGSERGLIRRPGQDEGVRQGRKRWDNGEGLGERKGTRVCGGERHCHSHGVHEVGQPKRGGALVGFLEYQVNLFNVWLHQPVHSSLSGQSSTLFCKRELELGLEGFTQMR